MILIYSVRTLVLVSSVDIPLNSFDSDLVWDIAPTFKAMLIFAEHRYYGQSLPYGNASFSTPEYSE